MRHVEARNVAPDTLLNLRDDASLREFHDHDAIAGNGRSLVLDVAHLDTGVVSLDIEGAGWVGFRPDHVLVIARPATSGPLPDEA